jgi:hypothetical protein
LSVIAEEGLGIIYLFDYYWRRAQKHVVVIFIFTVPATQSWGIFTAGKNVEDEL